MSATVDSKRWLADIILLGAVWGASFLLMHISVVEFGPIATAGVRVAIAALFLLPILLYKSLGAELRKHWKRIFFVGLLNSGIPFTCYAFAQLTITTGLSSLLNATVPLFGAVVAWLWLHDRPTRSRAAGLMIGFAGVAMLAWDQAGFKPDSAGVAPIWAILACIFGCLCYAISANYTQRFLSDLPPLVIATGSQIGATLGLALPALFFWPTQMPGPNAWMALIVVGVVSTGVAYILFFRLIAHAGPARALSATYVVPVFAVFYGLVFLGEKVTLWMLICGAVIVLGTALSTGLLKLTRWRSSS